MLLSGAYEQPVACLLLVVVHHLVALKILKAYLASKDKLYKLKKFEHNRFNVIFENAGTVVYHKDDIIDFLSKLSSMNMLQRSVLSDLKDANIYRENYYHAFHETCRQ